jgi:O-antigen ligase
MLQRITSLLLFLVGATLPFDYAHVDLLGLSWTPNKAITGLLLAVAVTRYMLEHRRIGLDSKTPWLALFSVAIFATSITAYFAGIPASSLAVHATSWFSLIAFYFLLVFLVRTLEEVDRLLRAFLLGVLIVTASGFLGYGFETFSQQGERIGGQAGNPNNLGFNLVVGIPVALSLLYTARSYLAKAVLAGASLFMLFGIGATLSRSAMLAIPVMGVLFVLRFRPTQLIRVAIPVALLASAGVLFMPDAVADRIATLSPTGARQDDSIISRVGTNTLALRAFAENPLIGIGQQRFLGYAIEHGLPSANVVHHAWLEVAAEQGLLGLVPFTLVTILVWRDFGRSVRWARQSKHRSEADRALDIRASMLQCAYLGTVLIGQFQPTIRFKAFWMLFALSTVLLRVAHASPSSEAARVPANRGLGRPLSSAPVHK